MKSDKSMSPGEPNTPVFVFLRSPVHIVVLCVSVSRLDLNNNNNASEIF